MLTAAKGFIQKALKIFGYRIVKIGIFERDDFNSRMLTSRHFDRLKEELSDIAFSFLSENLKSYGTITHSGIKEKVDSFFEIYAGRPVKNNRLGSGFHNCFWLYVMASSINPSLIIESGVAAGQTSWLFRQACPRAVIHGFDISLRHLAYRDESINFHSMDWSQYKFGPVNPSKSMCFFDCHVNQAKRIKEAHKRGFRILVFDDNTPAHKLYSQAFPGVPTVDMLLDEKLKPGELIKWKNEGIEKSYLYKEEDIKGARELIKKYSVFPDVGSITTYGGFSFLSLVELIDPSTTLRVD